MLTLLFITLLLNTNPSIGATSPYSIIVNQDSSEIIITEAPGNGNIPRTQNTVPIKAFLFDGYICVRFSSNLGLIDTIIEEITTGLITHTIIDSSELMTVIPFAYNQGSYTITFSLSSGDIYVGSFVIN